MEAALTLSFELSDELSVVVDDDAAPEAYRAAAKCGVIAVLLSQGSNPILGVRAVISEMNAEPARGSYAAFYAVACEAAEKCVRKAIVAPAT